MLKLARGGLIGMFSQARPLFIELVLPYLNSKRVLDPKSPFFRRLAPSQRRVRRREIPRRRGTP